MDRDFAGSVAVTLLIATLVLALTRHQYLEVHDASGHLLLGAVLPDGRFGIGFIHSVARSPVEDWFSPRGTQVGLDRTVYQDFGAGLPHEAQPGQKMSFRDGVIEISGYSLVLPRVEVRVGRVAEHSLLLPGSAYHGMPLAALARPGQSLSFSLQSLYWFEVFWRALCV